MDAARYPEPGLNPRGDRLPGRTQPALAGAPGGREGMASPARRGALMLLLGMATARAEDVLPASRRDRIDMLVLRDVHPLFGGRNLYLRRGHPAICQVITARPPPAGHLDERYAYADTEMELALLRSVIGEHPAFFHTAAERQGVPDESRTYLLLRWSTGRTVSVQRWRNDPNPDFDALYGTLVGIAERCRTGKRFYEGKWDRAWVPEGFAHERS